MSFHSQSDHGRAGPVGVLAKVLCFYCSSFHSRSVRGRAGPAGVHARVHVAADCRIARGTV